MIRDRISVIFACALLALLAGCATQPETIPPSDPAPRQEPQQEPRQEARSKYGNGPFYKVHGRRYQVMDSSAGYEERGVASWYGKKFHGRLTSSREPYDMYAMTAAHKTLPLPTWVRVTNLRNDRSVVVKVNDRGPFVANRIIDLSYAAALQLDIVDDGTGMVEVTAVAYGEEPDASAQPTVVDQAVNAAPDPQLFVQVGAFGSRENARRRFAMLADGGIGPAFVQEDDTGSPVLYRVRIGPIAGAVQYDSIVLRLQDLGISEAHLVTE